MFWLKNKKIVFSYSHLSEFIMVMVKVKHLPGLGLVPHHPNCVL